MSMIEDERQLIHDVHQSLAKQCAEQLATGWQCRVLATARGRCAAVVMAVLFNEYADHMPVLLRVAFPTFEDVSLPQITGCAAINKSGKVVCAVIDRDRRKRAEAIYESETDLLGDLRRLADQLKLNDTDRKALFAAVQRWIVLDERIDHMGEKVA